MAKRFIEGNKLTSKGFEHRINSRRKQSVISRFKLSDLGP